MREISGEAFAPRTPPCGGGGAQGSSYGASLAQEVVQRRLDGDGLLGTWLFTLMEKMGRERRYLKGG
jgi:hypothetical protein